MPDFDSLDNHPPEFPDFADDLPDSQKRITHFRPGQRFDGAVFAAFDMGMRTTKSGISYLHLKLRDSTGEVNAKLWQAPADILQSLSGAQLVKVKGQVETGTYQGDFRLLTIEAHPTPDDLTPYLPPLPADHKAHLTRFNDVVRSVKNPFLKELLKHIFSPKGQWWARFQVAPAARTMHHAYRGGLLEHSSEVAILCDRSAATLAHIDRDLLVTAALLHDIGKLEEMELDLEMGAYTPAGQLVGHVVLGTCIVSGAAEQIEGFPPRLKHELMHLILSHHGEPEWGAARRPMCAEALILSLCDQMSAKVAQCRDLAQNEAASENANLFPYSKGWHEKPTGSQNSVYIGLMRAAINGQSDDSEA